MRKLLFLTAFVFAFFCIFLFSISSCKDPAGYNTYTNNPETISNKPETASKETLIEFRNLEQYPVTIYSDSLRNNVFTEVAANSIKIVPSNISSTTVMAFYPTFRLLYPVGTPIISTISIPYNGPSFVHTIEANKTTTVPIPKLESIYINSSYLLIINKSNHSLALSEGGNNEKAPLNGGSTVINSGQNAAYSVFPGSVSSYSVLVNANTPVAFPADLKEFKQGIIHVLTYNGTSLVLTDEKSILQTVPPAIPENVRAETISRDSARITWDAVYGATSYLIYRATDSADGTYSMVANTATVSWIDTSLANGQIYYYKVSAVSDMESGRSAEVFVVMPTGDIWVNTVTADSVSLAWIAVSGATGYNIYRSDSENGTYIKINTNTITNTTFTDTEMDVYTTYYYKIGTILNGIESEQSDAFSIMLLPAPVNVQATALTDTSIRLEWDTVNDAGGYSVYRSASMNGTYNKINTNIITGNTFIDTGLNSFTTYYYKISAVSDNLEHVRSNAVSGTTLLSAPSNVRITTVTDTSVSLEWNAVIGASGYNVYRSASENGTYTKVNSSIITLVSYSDTDVSSNTIYYYKISAVSSDTEGITSSLFSVFTLLPAPVNVQATALTDTSISLEWNSVKEASGYNIYRSASVNGTYNKINSKIITDTTFTDTGLNSFTTYYYKVSAVSNDIDCMKSNAVSGTTHLPAPSNIRVTAVTDTSVSLEWNAVNRASGYNIYRSTSENDTYTKVNSSIITLVSYSDTSVSSNTNYFYKVCAVSSDTEGVKSNIISAITLITAPVNLRISAVNTISIYLEWEAVVGTSGYNVYRSSDENGTYNRINTGAIKTAEFTDTGITPYETLYFYKVSAVQSNGKESMLSSAISSFTTVPDSGLVAKLNWLKNNVASNSLYLIEVNADESIGPQTLSYSGKSGVGIFLNGRGLMRIITLSAKGKLFTINSGVTLILNNNITLKGMTTNDNSLVNIGSGGTLVMNAGTKITGNTFSSSSSSSGGGGVYVSGTFTMNGGGISGNTKSSTAWPFLSYGGGVYVKDGTFTMNGGEISGNTNSSNLSSDSDSRSYGGGVYVSGTFTMSGGKISGNTSSSFSSSSSSYSSGGGVYVKDGTFTMNGGEISGNTSSSSSSSSYSSGGGVYVDSNGTFTMSSGEISGNTSSSSYSSGGGVYVYNNGTFKMSGGEISGNTSSSGGGVYVYYATFTMSSGEISGNTASTSGGGVYVGSNGTFTKTGGGTVYGYTSGVAKSNVVKNSAGVVQNNSGHAVCVYKSSSNNYRRESTAGPTVNLDSSKFGVVGGWYDGYVSLLTANTWADGNIVTSDGEQWFKFTATASTQYIHVSFGTLNDLYVHVYDPSGTEVGSRKNLYKSTKYDSRTATSGQEYYIRVWPYSSNSGTFKIAFNTSSTPPAQ